MKSASQMSMLIRSKKKKMMDDPDVIDSGDSPSMDLQDEVIADQNDETKRLDLDHNDAHPMEMSSSEYMESSNRSEPEMEEPLSDEVHMMAEGGEVADEKEMYDPKVSETSVRPDKGFGKVIMVNAEGGLVDHAAMDMAEDHEEMDEAKMKRRMRIRKMMAR